MAHTGRDIAEKTEIRRHSLQTSAEVAEPRGCKINTLLFVVAAVVAKSPHRSGYEKE